MAYTTKYDSLFAAAEKKYGLPRGLLKAVGITESALKPTARSPVGAIGLMQFMPATARRFGINPRDPAQAIDGAGRYYKELLAMFGGDVRKAIASYNAGEGRVKRASKFGANWLSHVPTETRNYVARVTKLMPSSITAVADASDAAGPESAGSASGSAGVKLSPYLRPLLIAAVAALSFFFYGMTDMYWPVYSSARITSHLGDRRNTYTTPEGSVVKAHSHMGVDIAVPVGTPVHAIDSGTVSRAKTSPVGGGGRILAIDHPSGITSRYMHLDRLLVKAGQRVSAGQLVAYSGKSGSSSAHLHFEVRRGGASGQALDPEKMRAQGQFAGGSSYSPATPAAPSLEPQPVSFAWSDLKLPTWSDLKLPTIPPALKPYIAPAALAAAAYLIL